MRLASADIRTCIADPVPADDTGASLTTPIVQSAPFAFPTFEALIEAFRAEHLHHVYSRGQNPTVEVLEQKIAALEQGEACKCFASGMGAISAVLLGLVQSGDHVLFVNHMYGPTLQLAEHLRRFGISYDVQLDVSPDAVRGALRPNTRVVWMEHPGTMMFRVGDVSAIADVARAHGALSCTDNSWATPLLHKPLTLGVDIVVHSVSKYIGGHSDVMAGAVVTRRELLEQIFQRAYMLNGASLSPHDAWLVLRGLRTLPTRLQQHERDGLAVAEFLSAHPSVERVFHPALGEDRALFERQFTGSTALFSFAIRDGTFDRIATVINALRVFRIGVSWGGVESLVLSPNRGDAVPLDAQKIPHGLIRIAVGLEGADVLIDDLRQALGRVTRP